MIIPFPSLLQKQAITKCNCYIACLRSWLQVLFMGSCGNDGCNQVHTSESTESGTCSQISEIWNKIEFWKKSRSGLEKNNNNAFWLLCIHKIAFHCLHSETSVVFKILEVLAARIHLWNFKQELEPILYDTS